MFLRGSEVQKSLKTINVINEMKIVFRHLAIFCVCLNIFFNLDFELTEERVTSPSGTFTDLSKKKNSNCLDQKLKFKLFWMKNRNSKMGTPCRASFSAL
jgi:hypothetical protein